jgi:peptidyl-prolyl cis-trans isomerase C
LKHFHRAGRRFLQAGLILIIAALSACGNEEKKAGQALASVNGAEITVLQLNEELQRAGAQAGAPEATEKQLLEALIDRQLLQNEAARDKIDRDPAVVQAIERAKALILAQAYLKKRIGAITKPSRQEIEGYFSEHPEFFSRRKQFEMQQLLVASEAVDEPLKAAMQASKSLDEVARWLDAHKVKYVRAELSPTSAELAPELNAKLLAMPKGQLFIVQQGEHSMLISISGIKDNPVTLELAAPQIEQYLINQKGKEAARAELARLRSAAKIEYLNQPPAATAPGMAAATGLKVPDSAHERGVAGLK